MVHDKRWDQVKLVSPGIGDVDPYNDRVGEPKTGTLVMVIPTHGRLAVRR